jgi:hypothetical protein
VLDQDNEMAITAFDNFEDKETIIYLKKENIQSLKKHLEYILEQEQVKSNSVLGGVSGFSSEQMKEAYRDGYENDHPNEWDFDINNYR